MSRWTPIVTVLLAAIASLLGGCLVVSSKGVDECGVRISDRTLSQIRPGETSEAWLIATLGEPNALTVVDDEPCRKVLRYEHVVTRSSSGAVFLLFAGSSETRTRQITYFESVDGVIERYWTECERL